MSERSMERDVALLTGGWDRPYVFGLTTALVEHGLRVDLIAGDDLTADDFPASRRLRVLTYRWAHPPGAGFVTKALAVLAYYARLVRYAWNASPKIFHIVWNNGYDTFDRTFLMLYYRLLGKVVVLTAHNVNAGRRDAKDTWLNRLTLRFQYRLCDHIFVHTEAMKAELAEGFGIPATRVTVVPFGINNSVPDTALTTTEARQRLGIGPEERALLFFGNIAPYKGLEYLVEAFQQSTSTSRNHRLIVAGRPKPGFSSYWDAIHRTIGGDERILLNIEYIPDADTEIYFKAADVLVLPYTEIFQSGVLFLGYSFGLPTLASDVGSLKDDVVEGETGFMFAPRSATDLARAIERYFASDLFRNLAQMRPAIKERTAAAHSWDTVATLTRRAYSELRPLSPLQSSVTGP